MDNTTVSKDWFKYAERDLESAKFLMKMYPLPIEIICYHCEQSAEKIQKFIIDLFKHTNSNTNESREEKWQ